MSCPTHPGITQLFRARLSDSPFGPAPGGTRPRWKFDALPANGEVVNTINRSPALPSQVVLPALPGVDVSTDHPGACALRGQPGREYGEWENTPTL